MINKASASTSTSYNIPTEDKTNVETCTLIVGINDSSGMIKHEKTELRKRVMELEQDVLPEISKAKKIKIQKLKIELPTLNVSTENDVIEFNDDAADCYLLACRDGTGRLNDKAKSLLKSEHPDLFQETDDWTLEDIMSDTCCYDNYLHHQVVAKLVYEYQENGRIHELFDNYENGWTSYKTTYGIFRTKSFQKIDLDIDEVGEVIVESHEEHKVKEENDQIKNEMSKYKEQDKYAQEFINKIKESLYDESFDSKDIIEKLKAVFYNNNEPITYSDLIERHDLILGSTYKETNESFKAREKEYFKKREGQPDNLPDAKTY